LPPLRPMPWSRAPTRTGARGSPGQGQGSRGPRWEDGSSVIAGTTLNGSIAHAEARRRITVASLGSWLPRRERARSRVDRSCLPCSSPAAARRSPAPFCSQRLPGGSSRSATRRDGRCLPTTPPPPPTSSSPPPSCPCSPTPSPSLRPTIGPSHDSRPSTCTTSTPASPPTSCSTICGARCAPKPSSVSTSSCATRRNPMKSAAHRWIAARSS